MSAPLMYSTPRGGLKPDVANYSLVPAPARWSRNSRGVTIPAEGLTSEATARTSARASRTRLSGQSKVLLSTDRSSTRIAGHTNSSTTPARASTRIASGVPPRPGRDLVKQPLEILLRSDPQSFCGLSPPPAQALPASGSQVLLKRLADERAARAGLFSGHAPGLAQQVCRQRDGDRPGGPHPDPP